MTTIIVYDLSNKKLFEGTRREVKAFLRNNKINKFSLKERLTNEKQVYKFSDFIG